MVRTVFTDPDMNCCSLVLGSDQAALAVRHGLLDAYTEVANTAVTDSGQQACFQVSSVLFSQYLMKETVFAFID
jgi:hypothetical protein